MQYELYSRDFLPCLQRFWLANLHTLAIGTASAFGYGPVTPYHFCIGDDVIAMAVSNENGYFLSYGNQTVKLERSYLEAIKEAERILSKVWNTKPGWRVQ